MTNLNLIVNLWIKKIFLSLLEKKNYYKIARSKAYSQRKEGGEAQNHCLSMLYEREREGEQGCAYVYKCTRATKDDEHKASGMKW